LPISLTRFDAIKANDGKSVNIRWTTQSESNNAWFQVERSTDGRHFGTIEKMVGAGNSTSPRHYACVDRQPATGMNFYRLASVSYDGHYRPESKTVPVNMGPGDLSVLIYPNPAPAATTALHLTLPHAVENTLTVTLLDTHGRPVHRQRLEPPPGGTASGTIALQRRLAPGIYTVRFACGEWIGSARLALY
jgi:hypothetical protein